MNETIRKTINDASAKMLDAYSAERELNEIAKRIAKEIIEKIAPYDNVSIEDFCIAWQPADGWIFTDGNWEYYPSHDELLKLLSMG